MHDGMTLIEALHGPDAIGMVALIHFLRALDPTGRFRPPLRAALVFDDPNLRSERYGYLQYPELVRHADRYGYHAAMAMVPLDATCRNEAAVRLFRTRPDRLSLVMHGNNHSAHELRKTTDFAAALALGAQALRRIMWFETRTGLSVARVMMPPHAVWSRTGARALGALAYDGLSATRPYPTTEPAPARHALAGWTGADFIDGCSVIPRVPLSLDRTGLALRALLDQPLILYGHQADAAAGLGLLAEAAARVNGLGDVRWCSIGEIVQHNYVLRVHADTAFIRPGGQRMRVVIPAGVRRLTVNAPLGPGAAAGYSGWTASTAEPTTRAFAERIEATEGEVSVRLHSAWETDPREIASPRHSPGALLRRRFSELRDRSEPLRRAARSR
jgi:hypothetical protein